MDHHASEPMRSAEEGGQRKRTALGSPFLNSHSISSGHQVQQQTTPTLLGWFGLKVAWNEEGLLW